MEESALRHVVEVVDSQLAHEANTLLARGWELLAVAAFERCVTYSIGRPRWVEGQ